MTDALLQRVMEGQRQIKAARQAIHERLTARKVSPDIIDRVMRLNPCPRDGYALRGMHRTAKPGINIDVIGNGWFIRKFGRDAFDRIPKDMLLKRGKRVFVPSQAVYAREAA